MEKEYPEHVKKRIAEGHAMRMRLSLIPPAPCKPQDCEVEWYKDKDDFPDWRIKYLP
jgi:hypothetical protein